MSKLGDHSEAEAREFYDAADRAEEAAAERWTRRRCAVCGDLLDPEWHRGSCPEWEDDE